MHKVSFDGIQPGTLATRKDFLRMAAYFLARQPDDGGSPKIVDIGCAIGDMFGTHAINVDIKSLDEMKAEAKSYHGDIEIPNYVQSDAAHLPFRDFEFDVGVLAEILEHVDDPVAVVKEALRVAYFVIVCVPNEYQWSTDKNPFQPVEKSGHQRRFTNETFIATLREAGMEILSYLDWQYVGWAYFIAIGRRQRNAQVPEDTRTN